MDKQINERLIHFSGKAIIPEDIEDDVEYKVKGAVVEESLRDNQDGTWDKIFKVKIITVEKSEE